MLTNMNKIDEKESNNEEENKNLIDLDVIDEDKALLGFITDYLIKRGLEDTVTCLYNESDSIIAKENLPKLINSVNEIRGQVQSQSEDVCVLFEWWRVFWNILKESNKDKRKEEINNNTNNNYIKFMNKRTHSQQIDLQRNNVSHILQIANVPNMNPKVNPKVNSNVNPTINPNLSIYKKAKKKTIKCGDNLDISSLTGIERSLTATGLMNKDLNKLTAEEGGKIEIALKLNKVSKESWEMYLKLCKEYQKTRGGNSQISNTKNNKNSSIAGTLSSTNTINSVNSAKSLSSVNPAYQNLLPVLKEPSNYLGVIDQIAQPIDSRQLLLLRQSLFHEYLKRQQASSNQSQTQPATLIPTQMVYNNNNIANVVSNSNVSNARSNAYINNTVNTPNTNNNNNPLSVLISPPDFNENFFEKDEELNFNDFMNEYLV